MRKLWITLSAVVLAVIFILLVTPLMMGLWIQKSYPPMIKQFDTPHVTFEPAHFKRGWFRSQVQIQVVFHSAEMTLSGESIPLAQLTIDQEIQHGPLVRQTRMDGSRHWMIARAALHNESRADNLNFKANTLWTMANHITTELNIPHLLVGNDRQRIEMNQLAGTINFTPGDKHFQTQLSLANGVLYANNPEKVGNNIIDLVKVMELDNFVTRLDIRKTNMLWYGARHFEAQKIMIFPYGSNAITADNVAIDLNQDQQGDLTNFNLSNQIGSLTDGQFKIDQVQLALVLKNMNTALLESFAHVFMYGSDFQRFKLYSVLVDLFTKGMAVDLDRFQFNTSDGPVSIQAHLASPTTDSEHAGLLHLFENLNIQASANVPKAWLKKNLTVYYQTKKSENPNLKGNPDVIAQHYLDHWLTHRLLVPQDQQVSMAINYKDGHLLVNGEKPALDNFIFNESLNDLK